MKLLFVLFVSCAWTLIGAQNYYQALMDYLENRLLAIEDRMQLWHEQAHQYRTEMLDFKKLTSEAMTGIKNDHSMMFKDLKGASARMDLVEREMDYVETQNSPRACATKAEKVLEQEAWAKQPLEIFNLSNLFTARSLEESVKILKRIGSPKGMWTRDPKSSKLYVFNGTSGDTVYEFQSVLDFSRSLGVAGSRMIHLPSKWTGPGSAVYNGYLYYINQETDTDVQVVKFDLVSGSVTEIAMFPMERNTILYTLNPETVADLAVDDEGLWLLFTPTDSEPNISLAKMDTSTLDIEQIWDTRCPRGNAEAAFVVCGTVYVVYNTRMASRSRVQCVFDVNDMMLTEEAPLLYFPRRYGAHASLKYNPEENQLYGWDDGYQIIYRLTIKTKLLA
uniref:Olfactomedin-like 3a n=1 Tax=Xiphophorus couchianus TaxID=32473 RepID=A0A3B5MM57_9TELE